MSADGQEPEVAELILRLQDPDQMVRIHAGLVLGYLGPRAAEAVPALLPLLAGGTFSDRKLAALTLGKVGPAAAVAIPALAAAAADENEKLSELATRALENIFTEHARAA